MNNHQAIRFRPLQVHVKHQRSLEQQGLLVPLVVVVGTEVQALVVVLVEPLLQNLLGELVLQAQERLLESQELYQLIF
ncbi:hypothetical protein D3C87_1513640 [compost metagenome]